MKSSKRNILFIVAIVISLVFCASYAAAGETKADTSGKKEDAAKTEVTGKDEEGFILYKYSMLDAKKGRSSKITETTEGNKTTYKYGDHALSCRTVMTGTITKTASDKKTHVVGDFTVSENTFAITKLSFDFEDAGNKTRVGTMTIDGKTIDMKYFNYQ